MTEPIVEPVTPTPDGGTAKPDDVKPTEPVAAAPVEPKPAEPVVPEVYDLQMPDGVELDKAAADEFTTIAKELKLDQVGAQKLADIAARQAQRQAETHTKLVESWVEQVKADKEVGGDKLNENLGVARKALDTFGTPELRDVLNASGLGNHPAVIKAFLKIGRTISDDTFVQGSPPKPETDIAKRMFPTMN